MSSYWIKIISVITIGCSLSCAANTSQGETLYNGQCASCHLEQGQGLPGVIPPLDKSDFLSQNFELLPCIIRDGITDTIWVNHTAYSDPMAGLPFLKDEEVINIINYINEKWSYKKDFLTPVALQHQLSLCETPQKR